MLNAERLERIRKYIAKNKFASIKDLAVEFNTSTATIRRCLKQLEEERFIQSVRGGAVLASSGSSFEQPYQTKRLQNIDEKIRISQAACKLISGNDSIFLDSSSTVYEMTKILINKKNITVSTNDVAIASALNQAKDITTTVTGGTLRKQFFTLTGFLAEKNLEQMYVDYAFMGVDAISTKGHFMITNTEEIGIKRAAVDCASKAIVLCDHSKFNSQAFISLWDCTNIDLIITGNELGEESFKYYTDLGLKIEMV